MCDACASVRMDVPVRSSRTQAEKDKFIESYNAVRSSFRGKLLEDIEKAHEDTRSQTRTHARTHAHT